MENGVQVRQLFLVNLPKDRVFASWRRLEDFPKFMKCVEQVEEIDEKRSHWTVCGPAGRKYDWEAEIVDEEPGRVLAWRTIGESDIRHGGRVEFFDATGGRGTVVALQMSYESPVGGEIGAKLVRLFGQDPESQAREDLRRFKQLVETGEIPTIEGQPAGRDAENTNAADTEKRPARRAGSRSRKEREVTP